MTLGQVLKKFAARMQQQYDDETLTGWLGELDGMAIREIFDGYSDSPVPEDWQPYTKQTPPCTELLIPSPYDEIYFDFLRMKCDSWQQETTLYNNSTTTYNNLYATFGDYWRRTHRRQQPTLRI